ncbi:LTA synthase family protein [Dyella jiangningensis]|uniref:Sulfatase N-terminal domain-containing protein n=1 Tax=Dyella jiangningensis TaxID=1379159 RepID=A0A328P3J8_9GAMM|nr:LTA synthase family protein [Dyella jiangningensis]RAO75863.1 hypothetical protein CA260_17700 [Dyella jiangningensis]
MTWLYRLGVVVAALMTLSISSWAMDRLSLNVEIDSYLFSYGFWVSSIPVSLLLISLIALTGRACVSLLVSLAFLAALYAINTQKTVHLASTLNVFDFYLLKGIDWSSVSLFAHYINWTWILLACVALVLAVGLLLRLEKPVLPRNLLLRICMLACAIGVADQVLVGDTGRHIYDADRLRVSSPSPFLTQFHAGLIGSLFYAGNDMNAALNEPIDRQAVKGLLARLDIHDRFVPDAREGQQPDVVVIQSESFFDPGILNQVSDTHQLLPTLHRAFEHGVGGSMTVPTFGGGTLRTEFEVLTGIPLAAYPHVQFPYLQISRLTIPGLARDFEQAGYETVAVHGNGGEFWNRRHTFKSLGFSKFITAKTFGPQSYKDGLYLSDHSMTDEIIGQLERGGRPQFVFAISIEAHGPYRGVQVKDEALRSSIPAPAGVSATACEEFSHYGYHIAAADREFGRLWDYLEHRRRPYILVFYGDHLPGLEVVYQETTFRNGKPAEMQQVPWVVVGSGLDGANRQEIYAWMLPHEILKLAQVNGSEYLDVAFAAGRLALSGGDDADGHLLDDLYSAARLNLSGEFEDADGAHSNAP